MDATTTNQVINDSPTVARRLRTAIGTLIFWAVGLLFLFSGLAKLRQPYDFMRDVYAYELLGPPIGRWLAMTLPHIEVVLAVCLLSGLFRRSAALATAGLLLLFVIAQTTVIWRGMTIDCACFGSAEGTVVGLGSGVRTLLLLLGVLFADWLTSDRNTRSSGARPDQAIDRHRSTAGGGD